MKQLEQLTIRRIDDFHHHFRVQPTLSLVLSLLVPYCARAIAMPNLKPAIRNGKGVAWYDYEFQNALNHIPHGKKKFKPLFTIAIQDDTKPGDVINAHEAGAVAGKLYPYGVTTNAESGVKHFFSDNLKLVYVALKECDMPLLLHGELEADRILVNKREDHFRKKVFIPLLDLLPDQKIVFEHVSTKNTVDLIKTLDPKKIGATITAHHLMGTLNDVLGNGTHPHQHCMPVLKDFDDQDALIEAATSGDPHFWFGSDSAPHWAILKECPHGMCGQFTVHAALSMLAKVFEEANALDMLEDFTSRFGAEFYDLLLNDGTVTLERKVWTVPDSYGSGDDRDFQFVPPNAGETLQWQLAE